MTTTTPPDPQTATQAEIEGWLVGLGCPDCSGEGLIEGECDCSGEHESRMVPAGAVCEPCDASGRRFPFTRACNRCRGKSRILKGYLVIGDEPYVPTDEDYDPCTYCTDGRVAAVTLFGLLYALRGMGVDFELTANRIDTQVLHDRRFSHFYWDWTTEAELIEALERALAAAVQAEKGD